MVYDAQAQLYDLMENVNHQLQLNIKSHDGHHKLGELIKALLNSTDSQLEVQITLQWT
jgi:hypothetical protein